jgi:protein-S-isoprenylcysteine O-methyltransferase Ste14
MEIFVKLILCWVLYFIIHSVFAAHFVKKFFSRYFSGLFKYYRIIYNLFATLGVLAIFMYQSTFPQLYFYTPNTAITFLGLALASVGLILAKESFEYYDFKEFLGVRQMKGELEDQGLKRQGLLNYIRHPLYSASILLLLGYLIFAPSIINLITATCMVLYFFIGSYFEEKKLIRAFGEDYINYKKEVPAFIPHIRSVLTKADKAKN